MQDVRFAVRGLRRAPGFTVGVALTLALGVGANSAVFSMLERLYVLQPVGVTNAHDVHRIYGRFSTSAATGSSAGLVASSRFDYPTFSSMQAALGNISNIAAYTLPDSQSVRVGNRVFGVPSTFVSDNYFDVLGVRRELGRFFRRDEGNVATNPHVVVLSDAFWGKEFGRDSGVVGQTLYVAGTPYLVVGIAGKGFAGLELSKADLFVPLGAFVAPPDRGQPWYMSKYGSSLHLIAKVSRRNEPMLTSAATVIERRMNADMRGILPAGARPDSTSEIALAALTIGWGPDGRSTEYVISLRTAGIAVAVLLIACANIGNLLLVRTANRREEIAIRVALGVSPARIVSRFVIEALVLSLLGGAFAILGAQWGGGLMRSTLFPSTDWGTPIVDVYVVAFTFVVAIFVMSAGSVLSVAQAVRMDSAGSIALGHRSGSLGRARLQETLLAAQVAFSIALLAGTGLFVASLLKLQAIPTGFSTNELAFASVRFDGPGDHRAERNGAFPQVAARLAALPGVRGVAFADYPPMQGVSLTPVELPGIEKMLNSPPFYISVSSGYFDVTGVQVVSGRTFTIDDRRGSGGSVIVNEAMAKRFWPHESAVGKCFVIGRRGSQCSTVVGVVSDTRQAHLLETEDKLEYYLPLRAASDSDAVPPGVIIIRVRPRQMDAVEMVARSELRRLLPGAADVRVATMSGAVAVELRPWRLGASMFSAFASLALLVAAVGTYGTMSYWCSKHRHELGVRIALGATAIDIYRLVLKRAIALLGAGIVGGIALAIPLGRVLASLLYETSGSDPRVFALAAMVLGLVGIAASIVPAHRAVRLDPTSSMRAE